MDAKVKILEQYSVLLLDMGSTFMFGEDRFGMTENFYPTYRMLGGTLLNPDQVQAAIRSCYEGMLSLYESPKHYDDFPSLDEGMRRFTMVPGTEVPLLESVFATHERGLVPDAYAALLRRLRKSHRLGLLSNIWSRKESWLSEFGRVGIEDVFEFMIFSSDCRSIKPSKTLFRQAINSFPTGSRILFIGDSLKRDIEPAKSLGLATAWINPRGGHSREADHILRSLLEIESVQAEPLTPRS